MRKVLLLSLLISLWPAHGLAADTIAQGTWQKKSYAVQGQWRLIQDGDRIKVVLGDDFSTKNAPDLKIFLSKKSVAELNGKNAAQGALLAGVLKTTDTALFGKKMQGAQQFSLPDGTSLEDFHSIVLHCQKYAKLWAAAPLQ